jgi:small subunit ribosomal protein S8
MTNDIVADSLIRIKNGYMAKRASVEVSYSKLVFSICKLLAKEGYVADVKESKGKIEVVLKYDGATSSKKRSAVTDVQRISKPGLRVYKSKKNLPWVLNGLGIAVISTPKGIMTDKQARKEGVGGEILAYVW